MTTDRRPASPRTGPNPNAAETHARRPDITAEPRAVLYAIFSKTITSPFESDPEQAAVLWQDETAEILADISAALPYRIDFSAFAHRLQDLRERDLGDVRREYSALFEVGDDGPPVPLRAELVRSADNKLKEEVVRFYDYFSYGLKDDFSWAPDHLAVMLEFMQVLCAKEAVSEDVSEQQSLARAQLDFLDRHIVSWLPMSISRLVEQKREGFYAHAMTKLWDVLEHDRIWCGDTVSPLPQAETDGGRT